MQQKGIQEVLLEVNNVHKAFAKIINELKQESIIHDDDAGHRAVEIIEQIAEEYAKDLSAGLHMRVAVRMLIPVIDRKLKGGGEGE